jgi:hypothetical protein
MQSAPNDPAYTQLRKIRREDDVESASRPTIPSRPQRRLLVMKRTLLLILLVLGLVMLAVGGWTIQGLRWALGGGRDRRERLATA